MRLPFIRDESGATAIEYGLIASMIGIAIMTGVTQVGGETNNTFSAIEEGINPNRQFDAVTYENVNNLFIETGQNSPQGCNGLGKCGWGTAKAFVDEFMDYAAETGMDTSTMTANQISRIRQRATPVMNSQYPNVDTGHSQLGEIPTQNTEGYNNLRSAARDWLENCDAACFAA